MTRGRGRNPRKRTALDDLGDTLKDGIKTWEKGRIPFLEFLGSGAAYVSNLPDCLLVWLADLGNT